MKRIIMSIAALFALMTLLVQAQPKLVIEGGNTYHFGTRDRYGGGNPSYATIRFFNVGDSALTVQNPRPTCGCTTAPLDKNKIKSGDYATLSVKLYMNVSHGPYHKTIKIKSDDPDNPNMTLHLKANVNQNKGFGNLQLIGHKGKQFVTFGLMPKDDEVKGTMKIRNNTDNDVEITAVELEPKELETSIDIGDVIKVGKDNEYEFEVEAESDSLGEYKGTITLTTTDDKMKTLKIPVWGYVMED